MTSTNQIELSKLQRKKALSTLTVPETTRYWELVKQAKSQSDCDCFDRGNGLIATTCKDLPLAEPEIALVGIAGPGMAQDRTFHVNALDGRLERRMLMGFGGYARHYWKHHVQPS